MSKFQHVGQNYRMPKSVKTFLANIVDPHLRGHMKNMMLEAHDYNVAVAIELAKKKDKKKEA